MEKTALLKISSGLKLEKYLFHYRYNSCNFGERYGFMDSNSTKILSRLPQVKKLFILETSKFFTWSKVWSLMRKYNRNYFSMEFLSVIKSLSIIGRPKLFVCSKIPLLIRKPGKNILCAKFSNFLGTIGYIQLWSPLSET